MPRVFEDARSLPDGRAPDVRANGMLAVALLSQDPADV